MIDNRTAPYGALILRLSLGALFIVHDALKVFVFTPGGTAQFFESVGVPGFVAYLTMLAEFAGGIALILGFATRWVALATTPILIGAIFAVHIHNGFFFTAPNGGWEFPAFWAAALVVQALLGDGAYAVGSSLTRSGRVPARAASVTG